LYLPLDEYRQLPGVMDATRVGKYGSVARIGNSTITGQFMGIDRVNFADVAFWRYDFSPYRLGSLINLLANSPNAVLVPNSFLQENGLNIGDFFRLEVRLVESNVQLDAQIVGSFDYFPSWYAADDGPL